MLDLIATSTFGLEAVVARELAALGYESRTIQPGRMLFQGDDTALCRANLWLRAADRVLLRMGTFEATDFGVLFDATNALPWEQWIPADAAFPVTGRSIKSQLSSVPACQKIVKKAVVERLKRAYGVEWFAETGPKCSIEVALLLDQATLTLDTTGPGLHKRGYRRLAGKAPLKETLAAAMVMLSFWKPDRPIVDPFCGTGTIPIEAALIGRALAPGLSRTFAAESWPRIAAAAWEAARQEARDRAQPALAERIIGTDIDEEALALARHHAEKAGVAGDIHFQRRDFAELSSKREYGCVICNPPYGERLGERAEVAALYRAMPTVLRRLKTWSHYILTSYPDFEDLVGQPADRRRKLYNGRIACTYYQFHGPKPCGTGCQPVGSRTDLESVGDRLETCPREEMGSRGQAGSLPYEGRQAGSLPHQAKPAFGGLTPKALEQAAIFRARLTKQAHHLRRWPARLGITCYRLYDRDVPEIPLVVDRYEECEAAAPPRPLLHVSEYDRPHDRTPAEHADWLDLMCRTAGEVLHAAPADVFLKRRQRQRGPAQYERLANRERVFIVGEGGLRFRVNLSDYIDTGLFLDHRITRSMVREATRGKRFLNLFGYTGAFSVYAAAGGAESTTTVDLSPNYLDWARENMRLNGFAGEEHHFVQADALSFLRHHPRRGAFDLAVVDPPTFSNSKRLRKRGQAPFVRRPTLRVGARRRAVPAKGACPLFPDYWDVQRDHAELLARLLEWMAPGGVIFFATNFRRFKLTAEEIGGVTVREISRQTVPLDFRNRRIHRCWRLLATS